MALSAFFLLMITVTLSTLVIPIPFQKSTPVVPVLTGLGLLVGAAALTHCGKANSRLFVVSDCRMATMALSAFCSLLLASVDQRPDLFRFIRFLLSMVTLTLSTLVIPIVTRCSHGCFWNPADSHVLILLWRWFAPLLHSELHSGNAFFFSRCQWHSCGLNRVVVSYRWLHKHCRFLLLFMLDGHNGTVHTSSASCSTGGYLSTSTPVVQNPTNGHVDTVGVANGHLDAVGYVLVVRRECPLPLPVDGHHDSVDCSCGCRGWPQWHCPLP
jgi:hypothetical protein